MGLKSIHQLIERDTLRPVKEGQCFRQEYVGLGKFMQFAMNDEHIKLCARRVFKDCRTWSLEELYNLYPYLYLNNPLTLKFKMETLDWLQRMRDDTPPLYRKGFIARHDWCEVDIYEAIGMDPTIVPYQIKAAVEIVCAARHAAVLVWVDCNPSGKGRFDQPLNCNYLGTWSVPPECTERPSRYIQHTLPLWVTWIKRTLDIQTDLIIYPEDQESPVIEDPIAGRRLDAFPDDEIFYPKAVVRYGYHPDLCMAHKVRYTGIEDICPWTQIKGFNPS